MVQKPASSVQENCGRNKEKVETRRENCDTYLSATFPQSPKNPSTLRFRVKQRKFRARASANFSNLQTIQSILPENAESAGLFPSAE